MHAHPPGGAEDDLVDDRRAGIDQQVASSCRVHHITDMASVHPLDHDEMLLAKKGACTTWISIATGDLMALAPKQFAIKEPVAPTPRTKIRMKDYLRIS